MKVKRMYLMGAVVLLLVAGFFYWFQLRPAEVRKQCLEKVRIQVKKEIDKPGDANITNEDINNMYKVCLIEHGMKSESIY